MPSCVGSALSGDGHVLVTRDLTYDDPDPSHIRKVLSSTYRVTTPLKEWNQSLRVKGRTQYWPDSTLEPYSTWTISFKRQADGYIPACEHLFVTSDAQFLVLIGNNLPASGAAVQIYRCCEKVVEAPGKYDGPNAGVLVRNIPLHEIIPPPTRPELQMDFSPQWYSGGTWSLSSDNRTLDFRRDTGDLVQIDLATGKVRTKKL